MDQWVDRGDYWEHIAEQRDPAWLDARKGRCTTTRSDGLVYHSRFGGPEKTGKLIAGVIEEVHTPEAIERMNHGVEFESKARDYYVRTTGHEVIERNLVIPKNMEEMWIGASVDGDVAHTDGIIEIKCPQKMYKPLLQYSELKAKGIHQRGYRHIFDKHLHQMMQGMYIMKKKWCDYIVYVNQENVFIQRIYFDSTYWNRVFYPELKINYIKYVIPHLEKYNKENGTHYPLCPK